MEYEIEKLKRTKYPKFQMPPHLYAMFLRNHLLKVRNFDMFCKFVRQFLPDDQIDLGIGCINGKIIKVELSEFVPRKNIYGHFYYIRREIPIMISPVEKLPNMELYAEKIEYGNQEYYLIKLKNPSDLGYVEYAKNFYKKIR